jgi:hypothetical protein
MTRKKDKPNTFRQHQAQELELLARLFRREYWDVFPDTSPLHAAAKQCRAIPEKSDSWGYKLNRLQIHVEKPRHTLPENINGQLIIELSVSVAGKCQAPKMDDPFEELAVNLVILGRDNNTQQENLCAWHLDRHIDSESEAAHPLYHWQYGGNRMEHLKDNLGSVLLLETPRLSHPPMEGILAIDFVLSNFAGNTWKKLKTGTDGTYRNLVTKAQERFWYPYAKSIVAKWENPPTKRQNLNTLRLWPNLIDI